MNAKPTGIATRLSAIVGHDFIILDHEGLAPYSRATFATTNSPLLVVKPDSTVQVQDIVRIAGEENIPVYPIGRGCNWGLGSKVPLKTGAIIIDFSRMNRIHKFSEEQGFIQVEPGVTFQQVTEYLKEHESKLFLSVIGGHPYSSIIGNTLERGDGLGPLGDRARFVCDLEVVLADGTKIATGLSNFCSSDLASCAKDPIGPSLDGLFFQSNLAIVTRMTVWLQRQAHEFTSGLVTFSNNAQLERAIPSLRMLQEQGVIKGNCLAIWNIYKVIAAIGQHPLLTNQTESSVAATCLNEQNLSQHLPAGLKNVRWLVTFGLYAATNAHMKADCRLVKKLLKPHALKTVLITKRLAWTGRLLSKPVSIILGFNLKPWLDAFYYRSVFRGHTTELSIRSIYWRKPGAIPDKPDPDADRCGLLWLCHLVPNTPNNLTEASKLSERICSDYGLEANIAYLNTSERYFRMFIALMYDRDIAGADSNALSCQNELQTILNKVGYSSYRLGLQSMQTAIPNDNEYKKTINKIKRALDPNNIIAPGHYDFS